jgi:endoglucanase
MKVKAMSILKDLVSIDGVSGFEKPVADYISSRLSQLHAGVRRDVMGNVLASLRLGSGEPSLKLMFCAHMDEVGLMVKGVEPDGFIRFEKVGVIPDAFLSRTPVRIKGINGTIGTRPGYLMEGSDKPHGTRDMYVDVGASSSEEICDLGIEVGDPISFATAFSSTGNPDRILAKAVDDRAGCTVLLLLAELLSTRDFCESPSSAEVVLAFTAQEEVGCRGAAVAAAAVRPDCAFVLDTVPSGDTPDASMTKDINARLGGGVVIPVMSGGVSMGEIMAEPIKRLLRDVADEKGIPYQLAILPVAATDSSAIKTSGDGVPVGTIGIPRRYAHSPVELVDLNDVMSATQLALGLTERLLKGVRLR